ncbi:MAG: efflux RND transporter periplasmic adaptor subunit [Proteobacteria bacterium]|nr:efflux RND transporter periplasmic adaptor subunit [Pseudomonadota bacterium]MCL2308296.1 efflux RND transporter periplasmic adaptor subunit [Pseudomonadota bacterium]
MTLDRKRFSLGSSLTGGGLIARRLLLAAVLLSASALPALAAPNDTPGAALLTAPVTSGNRDERIRFDGVVEAVRQTVIAAQVQGAVVALPVKVGDKVRAGQVLARLDARAAEQSAVASAAQVEAARAARDAAAREYERQQQLFRKNYISQAALDRAEAQYKATQAETAARLASADAARTQSGFYVIQAPYDGVVVEANVVLGDMAMPGRPLLTLYDPAALRVRVMAPESMASAAVSPQEVGILFAGGNTVTPTALQWLPSSDPGTHTRELRLTLPSELANVRPGQYAQVALPVAGNAPGQRLYVPISAVVRRAELTAVYVIGQDGKPLLRQVRLGLAAGDRVEVLSGVRAGEQVALDPQAAARIR